MRKLVCALTALALTACSHGPAPELGAVKTVPATPAPLNDAGVLFWPQEMRTERFRQLENFYPGLEVAAAPRARALPRGKALDPAAVRKIDTHLDALNAVGIMVLQNGRVRHEAYRHGFGADQRWTSFSVAKSFTSTLLGAAVKEGKLALADPVTRHLPQLAGTAYDGVTVEQVAMMTSGVKWNEDYADPKSDVARMLAVAPVAGEPQSVTYARTLTREAPAGSKWVYKTLETNLLGDIVAAATGQSLAAYAKTRIVDPAGFAGPLFWMTDLTGRNIGGCCLSVRLSDYARMGQWVLEGAQPSVPEGWFTRAGGRLSDFGNGYGYGYQWWAYPSGFGAQGIFGQYITLIPSQNVVIAVVSSHRIASGKSLTEARAALWQTVLEATRE